MTQMTTSAGIKKHGQIAVDALIQEFAQLRDLGVFQHSVRAIYDSNRRGGHYAH
jgi:hypothetical protein